MCILSLGNKSWYAVPIAWNYYPPITQSEQAAAKNGKLPPRLHAHADMDVITLLYQRDGRPNLRDKSLEPFDLSGEVGMLKDRECAAAHKIAR